MEEFGLDLLFFAVISRRLVHEGYRGVIREQGSEDCKLHRETKQGLDALILVTQTGQGGQASDHLYT